MLHKRAPNLVLTMACTMVGTTSAQAQIDEIIVTAEHRESTLQDTSISMTVMDDRTLQELGATTFVQIGDFSPNVMMYEAPGKVGGVIAIRGFKNGETISTFEPKVALYLDGVLIAKNAGSAFDILDLERVEILRGPQGTLYGRNTAGGAVNLITKKPHDEFEGSFAVTVGNFSQRDVKGNINIPLTDTLALKATLASLNRDGYWRNDSLGRDEADRDRVAGQLQLQWQPTDDLNVLYAYDRTEVDENTWPVQLLDYNPTTLPELAPHVGSGSSSRRNLDWAGYQKATVDGHSLNINWDMNEDMTLVSISSLRRMEVDGSNDSDASPEFVFANRSGDEAETFTQELRLVGNGLGDRLKYVLGAFYMHEDIGEVYNINVLPNFGLLESGTSGSAKNKIWAVFGEGTYNFTEKFDLTFGLRYTDENREMSRVDIQNIPALGMYNRSPLPDASGNFSDVSGTVSASYDWTDDLMTYVKVSKGYVSGGFNIRSPSPATFQQGYDEETVYTYELGWKSTWLNSTLQVNGALFYNEYKDLQVNLLDAATAANNIGNAGEAVSQGLEIELLARPTERLDLGAGYGHLDTEYKTYIDPASGADLSTNDFGHAPRHTVNAWARYTVPDFQQLGDLSVRLDWSYRDKHALIPQPGNRVPSYDFLNARISLDNIQGPYGTWLRVSLWGQNLTDEVWYTSGYNLLSSIGFRAAATSPPRTFGVDFEIGF